MRHLFCSRIRRHYQKYPAERRNATPRTVVLDFACRAAIGVIEIADVQAEIQDVEAKHP